jgi:hypothetical protein
MTAERLHLGWQYAVPCADPGPPPRRPTPPEQERINPGWLAAQRREENLLSRPQRLGFAGTVALVVLLAVGGLAGWINVLAATLGGACAAMLAGVIGHAIWRGERALRSRIEAEHRRVSGIRAETERRLFAWQAEHAAKVRAWQAHRVAYERQKRWYAVTAPPGIQRVDVAGGTLSGWSAMLTTAGAYLLADGGQVTVLDLTESAVALDLIAFAGAGSVRIVPDDLPRLDAGLGLLPGAASGLGGRALADVLALTVNATEEQGSTRDLSFDRSILERVIAILGDRATVAGVTAGLRTLAQIGDPADDVRAGLVDADQVDQLRAAFGTGAADRVVIDRAWTLAAQLGTLAALGTDAEAERPTALRVLALSRRAGALDGKVLAAFLAVSLAHVLRQAERDDGWRHTLFVLAAERLRADVLDRLSDACERTGTGLVLAYRDLSPPVRQRLGRGDAAIAFMRLGNAEDARAASEQLGTEHRFVLAQLTETVGESVTDTTTGSYTSTSGQTGSVTASRSASFSSSSGTSHGSSAPGGPLAGPFAGGPFGGTTTSRGIQATDSQTDGTAESVSAGLSVSTAWGQSTSATAGASESLARTMQRSREFLVEQYELQRLPASAMLLSYAGPAGREVVLADVNPGIGALSTATTQTLAESQSDPPPIPAAPSQSATPVRPIGTENLNLVPAKDRSRIAAEDRSRFGTEPPNLGPPPPRLDWRRRP